MRGAEVLACWQCTPHLQHCLALARTRHSSTWHSSTPAPGTPAPQRYLLYFPGALRRRRAGDREPPAVLRLQRARLEAPEIARGHRAGQFVMVKPDRGIDPLLRRPFSVFEILRDGTARRGHLDPQQARRHRRPRRSSTPRPDSACSASGRWGGLHAAGPRHRGLDGRRRRRPGAVLDGRRDAGGPRRDAHALLRRPPRRRPVLPRLLRTARRPLVLVHRGRLARRARPRDGPARARAGRAGATAPTCCSMPAAPSRCWRPSRAWPRGTAADAKCRSNA